jgi:hypothetical protein
LLPDISYYSEEKYVILISISIYEGNIPLTSRFLHLATVKTVAKQVKKSMASRKKKQEYSNDNNNRIHDVDTSSSYRFS